MDDMTAPEILPRRRAAGVVAVWVAAALVALAVVFVDPDWRGAWLLVGFGFCFFLAFAVQLASGRSQGFIIRIAASVLGAMLVMGLLGAGFALAELFAG
jgi:FtsH-binding integral membrane protein